MNRAKSDLNSLPELLAQLLAEREASGGLRTLNPCQRNLIDFASNDYLGLAREKESERSDRHASGSTGSRLISGTTVAHLELESYLADFYQAEAALIFNSGYNANLGVFSAIARREVTIFYDQLVHASIRDGLRLGMGKNYCFKHNDTIDLAEKLSRCEGPSAIVVESIYSMDGDQAPLFELVELAEKYQAQLIVDEAHSSGIYGQMGQGLVTELELTAKVWARVHTFGKALGTHGAVVVGSQMLKDFLVNYSRAFIYTTALPVGTLQTIRQAHLYIARAVNLRTDLTQKIAFFKELRSAKLQSMMTKSASPIQAVILPGNTAVKKCAGFLQERGFFVYPILSPTVSEGSERLRISLHTYNTNQEISALVDALNSYVACSN
ncbi:8-amino-7-oxononanoate synthase [bacterium]|nr:8-amino-7-oxononanoate synthase [bacterium]